MAEMYKGIPFSPQVALADGIGAGDTVIKVTDITAFPAAPSYATIGTDEEGETILYAAKTSDSLSGCTRGVEGTAKAWPAGTTIARNFTNKDFEALQENIKAAQNTANSAVAAAGTAQTSANNAQNTANKAISTIGNIPKNKDGEDQTVVEYVAEFVDSSIGEITLPRFGVSGVGGSSATLTRLWDSIGLSVMVSTDTIAGSSGFDEYAPFNRKKCVGTWSKQNSKAKFTVAAYYGDADYAEDGSMGDYVAIEIKPFYYYEKDGILGVSEQQYPGWKIHPVCVDYDGNIRENTYIPAYAMAQDANGHAVSLPGLFNSNGAYKTLWDYAKTYADSDVATFACLEPSAVNHYEWLLMTIEFATQNVQSYMNGATTMIHGDSYTITSAPANNKAVVGSWGASLVVGQTIKLTSNIWDGDSASLSNVITKIEKCDADGTVNSSGSYYLITYDGANRSATAGTTKLVSRPWRTGACTGALSGIGAVKGHTGYTTKNDGKYPCMYRYHENPYGNQYNTSLDMADTRIADGDSFHLEWYFLADPRKYTPSSTSKPDAADLDGADTGWVKLDVITPVSSYADGYIKEFGVDSNVPWVKVPVNTKGGGSNSYYSDYAALVNTYAVRSVRRGGSLYNGSIAGPCFMIAINAPSNGTWYYGGALHFIQ